MIVSFGDRATEDLYHNRPTSRVRRFPQDVVGLALVKFVVEAHHGEVWATSKIGAGSTFGFRVPKALKMSDLTPSL